MEHARYFSLVATMSMHLPPTSAAAASLQAQAMERLEATLIDAERQRRGHCLDSRWSEQVQPGTRW